jgi:hypothetical protein
MNSSGIEHLKYFDNTVKSKVVTCSDIFKIQQSCQMEYSPVQRRLIIYNQKESKVKFIDIDIDAKPFVNNKKRR